MRGVGRILKVFLFSGFGARALEVPFGGAGSVGFCFCLWIFCFCGFNIIFVVVVFPRRRRRRRGRVRLVVGGRLHEKKKEKGGRKKEKEREIDHNRAGQPFASIGTKALGIRLRAAMLSTKIYDLISAKMFFFRKEHKIGSVLKYVDIYTGGTGAIRCASRRTWQ